MPTEPADPPFPCVVWDIDNQGFRAVCKKCHYEGPLLSDQLLADSLLKRHKASREHKYLSASPNRYKP